MRLSIEIKIEHKDGKSYLMTYYLFLELHVFVELHMKVAVMNMLVDLDKIAVAEGDTIVVEYK